VYGPAAKKEKKEKFVELKSASKMTPKDEIIGKIYFVQLEDWGPIKIGWTEDLNRRIDELNHNSPFRVRLLASLEETKPKEGELHQKFSAVRIVGKKEWFWPVQALLISSGHYRNRLAVHDPDATSGRAEYELIRNWRSLVHSNQNDTIANLRCRPWLPGS
jgi:hypothetical protein